MSVEGTQAQVLDRCQAVGSCTGFSGCEQGKH